MSPIVTVYAYLLIFFIFFMLKTVKEVLLYSQCSLSQHSQIIRYCSSHRKWIAARIQVSVKSCWSTAKQETIRYHLLHMCYMSCENVAPHVTALRGEAQTLTVMMRKYQENSRCGYAKMKTGWILMSWLKSTSSVCRFIDTRCELGALWFFSSFPFSWRDAVWKTIKRITKVF